MDHRIGSLGKFFPVLAFLLAGATQAWGAESSSELRLWATVMFGPTNFSSTSNITNTQTSVRGNQPGIAGQAELWLGSHGGIIADGELVTVNLANNNVQGKFINFANGNLFGAFRLFGKGPRSPELVFFSGPSINHFSAVRTYPGQSFYDVNRVNVFGAKTGARMRIPFDANTVAEASVSYFTPLSLVAPGGRTLDHSGSTSISTTARVDYFFKPGLNFGAGFRYEVNRLTFVPVGTTKPESVNFTTAMPMLFLGFSL